MDILSLGGTKNGALFGEAVVVLNQDAVSHMKHLRKLSMQLHSKMRFVSVQLEALLAKDLWLRNARHANAMATAPRRRGACGATGCGSSIRCRPTRSSPACRTTSASGCRSAFRFYFWDEAAGDVRWMCSFDTAEADVDAFVAALKEEMAR